MKSIEDWLDEVARLGPTDPPISTEEIVELIREGREERLQQVLDAIGEPPGDDG